MHKIVRMFDNGQPYLKFFELTCDNESFCFQKNMFQTHKRFNVIIKKPYFIQKKEILTLLSIGFNESPCAIKIFYAIAL